MNQIDLKIKMRSYTLIAPAKINLYLEILGDRPDGYHELAMVMQNISLADRIDLRSLSVDKIQLHCPHPQVPKDATNLAYRAAELMVQQFPNAFSQYGGVEITIDKQIPVAAGLAGGSTNAAAVLVGIDLLWNLGLTQIELQELGAKLGSDVPFCLAGGTAIATGRGEQISPLPDLDKLYVVLGKHRNLAVSTAWAYSTYRQQFGSNYASDATTLSARSARVHSGPLVNAIAHQDGAKIGQLLHNDLEKVVLPAYPQVLELREAFQNSGALGTMMSGSGPTVFALAASNEQAQQIYERVKAAISHPDLDLWIAKCCPTAIHVTNS
jgi:4-diphosphocytidyl-2-C-methyl-D-erythritol kinase